MHTATAKKPVDTREICNPKAHTADVVLVKGGGLVVKKPGIKRRIRQGV